MKILSITAGVILVTAIMTASACRMHDTEPQPYEYTSNTKLKQIQYYENERIKNAGREVVMTLEQLGYSNLTLTGGEEADNPSVEYVLPDDATQGPDKWYISNFHFLIEFEEETGGGFCDVQASPLGSVQVETLRVNDSPFIRVGNQSSTSTRIEVRYYNYMGSMDIRPGKKEMTFKFKEYQGTKIKSVTVFNDTGIEVTGMPPSDYEAGQKLTQEELTKAKEIAFTDSKVQAITEGKEYALRITSADGLVRSADEPPDDDIELRLVFTQEYMIEDVEASALDIFVDLNEGKVTYLFPLGTSGMPELTASERERAAAIALSDAGVQKELEGKEYMVTRVGITMGGQVGRLGANVMITFEEPFLLEGLPSEAPERQVTGVAAFVNLKEGRVVDIITESQPIDLTGGEA